MTAVKIRATNLLTGGVHHIEYDDKVIGAGRQGAVYPVLTIDGIDKREFLLKLYGETDPDKRDQLSKHLTTMVRHLEAHQLEASVWAAGLEGVFRSVVRQLDGDSRLGVLVYRVVTGSNSQLDSYSVVEQLGKGGLAFRLRVARQIADCVTRLHSIGVVPADITGQNILIETDLGTRRCARAYLVDVDGGGVRAPDGSYLTRPLVLGQNYECWKPPEIEVGSKGECDEVSDRWTVAVAIHTCLFLVPDQGGGWISILPFWWEDSYPKCCGDTVPWPPDEAVKASEPEAFSLYSGLIADLGRGILSLLRRSFGTATRVRDPNRRPTAEEWAAVLARAERWLYRCEGCGHEFLAEDRPDCRLCGRQIPHASLQIGEVIQPVLRDYLVNGRSLSLPSTDMCARLERCGPEMYVYALQPLSVAGKPVKRGAVHTLKPLPISANDGYEIRMETSAGSQGGTAGTFRIQLPAGGWSTQALEPMPPRNAMVKDPLIATPKRTITSGPAIEPSESPAIPRHKAASVAGLITCGSLLLMVASFVLMMLMSVNMILASSFFVSSIGPLVGLALGILALSNHNVRSGALRGRILAATSIIVGILWILFVYWLWK